MKKSRRYLPLARIAFLILFALPGGTGRLSATGTEFPTTWKFEALQNSSSEWWQSLRIQTVPGVRYYLQKSESLAPGDWENTATIYGSGAEWICPLCPGSPPPVPLPPGSPVVPAPEATPMRVAHLILERTTGGTTLLSWVSLDDGSLLRMPLPATDLDPVWDEFNSFFFDAAENHFFALSPRLGSPVTFSGSAPSLGTLDSAMIAEFIAALPDITENIANSVATAAQFNPASDPQGERAFYRVAADWTLDSDGDGLLDWQELILYDSNPFSADSDGDGLPDQDPALGAGPGALPAPTDAEDPTPLASIEQQVIYAGRFFVAHNQPGMDDETTAWAVGAIEATAGEIDDLEDASTYAAFRSVASDLTFSDTGEWFPPANFSDYYLEGADVLPGTATWSDYTYQRTRFRLKLDAPAPPGGYRIPLRIAIAIRPLDPEGAAVAANPAYAEIFLECEEGLTEGVPVEFDPPVIPATDQRLIFIPLSVSVSTGGDPAWSIPADGTCVTSNELIRLDCGNSYVQSFFDSAESEVMDVYWSKRKLNGNGTLQEWTAIHDPTQFDPGDPFMPLPLRGSAKTVFAIHGGIYQLKAELRLPDATKIDFPFVRMRDGRSIVDSTGTPNLLLKAGQPDYFGICENPLSKTVRNAAVAWLGATGYREGVDVPIEPGNPFNPGTFGKPKCNLFVTHIANSVGATTPYFNRKRFGITTPQTSAPIAKDDWHYNPEDNVDIDLYGWHFLAGATYPPTDPTVQDFTSGFHSLRSWIGGPCPGMAVTSPRTAGGMTYGHVGIMDYDGSWINAGSKKVTKCLHLSDTSTKYKPNNFRSR